MSGWDEGNVFYSDQDFPNPTERLDATAQSRSEIQRQLKNFIKSYQDDKGHHKYREELKTSTRHMTVELDDLQAYSSEILDALKKQPTEILPLFEAAAAEAILELKMKPVAEDEDDLTRHPEVQILLRSNAKNQFIRELSAPEITQLVKIPGIIISASKAKSKAVQLTLICKNCKTIKYVACKAGFGQISMPRTCDHQAQGGEEPCPLDPFVVLPERSKYVDQQTLKMQENPEDVPVGELPRNLLLSVDRHMVQKAVPGMRVTIVGIYSIFQPNQNAKGQRNNAAVRTPYLRVVGLEQSAEGGSRDAPMFTNEEELEFKEFAAQPNVCDILWKRMSPSIFGHEDVKKAICCLLFGGSRKRLPDGVRLRGDINVLLLGDPSTAKSQFLKFVEKTAPIAVYTSGKGSSAAGLTASVIRDPTSREFYLEGGAMVLADGGVVCIDEFDKMRPEDRVAIHEAMEQQTISIAKAGITTVLNSRASVLAAANPPSGRYDDLKSAQENIDLQTTILSRFDLIFIVRDARNHARDMMIARHVINVHASADSSTAATADTQERELWLKRYIEYCRHRISPRLSENAALMLQQEYVTIRQQTKQRTSKTGVRSAVPITVRQLEAIVRISESIARMQLTPVATEQHVAEALRLFKVSTLHAAESGIHESLSLSPEQTAEIQQVETLVKRRLGIGAHMSERRLVEELYKQGVNDFAVRRALYAMEKRGEIAHQGERRIIQRSK